MIEEFRWGLSSSLVEHLPCKQEVVGSSPTVSTLGGDTMYGTVWTVVGILLIVLLLIMIF